MTLACGLPVCCCMDVLGEESRRWFLTGLGASGRVSQFDKEFANFFKMIAEQQLAAESKS